MTREFILSLIRHALTGIGSVMVARGYADAGTTEAIIGGVLAVIGLGMSWRDKASRLPA